MIMVKDVIKDCVIGTIQNGSFVPIGKTDHIAEVEYDRESNYLDNNTSINLKDNYSAEFTCYISKRSRRKIESLFIYGWRNEMPFRRRTLINAINDRVNRDWRNFINEH